MKKIIIGLVVVFILAAGGGFVYSITAADKSDTIFKGVSIENEDVGGLTKAEAKQKVNKYVESVKDVNVHLKTDEETISVKLLNLGVKCDVDKAVDEAYKLGRSGNIIERFKERRKLSKKGENITVSKSVSQKEFKKIINKNKSKLIREAKSAKLKRENGSFVVTPGQDGQSIPIKSNFDKLVKYMSTEWDDKDFTYPLEVKKAKPEYTTEDLKKVKDLLGTYTTNFASSAYGRAMNVETGAKKINGTILYPGEVFSVYKTVSPFTAENGYALAGAYASGEVVQSMGGGICQVTTTLYNAVIRSELQVLERFNHQMVVSYVPISADAAISGEVQDFKFKNNLDLPIYIEAYCQNRNITFNIYGAETRPKNRKIEIRSETTSVTQPGKPKETKDKNLKEGVHQVTQEAHVGYTGKLWKDIYVDGKKTESVQINSSSYAASPQRVTVGTKKDKDKKDKDKDKDKDDKDEDDEDSTDSKDKGDSATTTEKKDSTKENTDKKTETSTKSSTNTKTNTSTKSNTNTKTNTSTKSNTSTKTNTSTKSSTNIKTNANTKN